MSNLKLFLLFLIKKINTTIKKKNKKKFGELLQNLRLTLIDVGASIDIINRWKNISKKNLNYVLFEPNKKEVAKLEQKNNNYDKYKVFQTALSSKKHTIRLNITKGIYQSSILKPNYKILDKYPDVNRYKILNKLKIEANPLDKYKIKNSDFIKIDVQGYNYEVLLGAKNTLKKCLGLEVEVEFVELYKKQKLFGDLCEFLKSQNMYFIDFIDLVRWERDKFVNNGQCVFGNALFLKLPEKIISKNEIEVRKYIAICLLYKQFDLIRVILKNYRFGNKDQIYKLVSYFEKKQNKINFLKTFFNGILKLFDEDRNIHFFK